MQTFTGYEYVLIDIANNYGLDKELFESRIQWASASLDHLESEWVDADEPILFRKAVSALRKAQQMLPTGHMIGMDACSSGLQIMGALSGCAITCLNTGLIDPNVRADVYTTTTKVMGRNLGSKVEVTRKDVKYAQMTHFYLSKRTPKELFGEDTPELAAFYDANYEVAPGACEVLDALEACWQQEKVIYWTLPDGHHAYVPHMVDMEATIKVDELDGAQFTHYWSENQAEDYGLDIPANVIHSVDGFVVAEMSRRCDYDEVLLREYLYAIRRVLVTRKDVMDRTWSTRDFLSLVFVEQPTHHLTGIDTPQLHRMAALLERVQEELRFHLVCVHDEFKCLANHVNTMRQRFIDIMAELAESYLLEDIINEVTGEGIILTKTDPDLGRKIRGSNYGIC